MTSASPISLEAYLFVKHSIFDIKFIQVHVCQNLSI